MIGGRSCLKDKMKSGIIVQPYSGLVGGNGFEFLVSAGLACGYSGLTLPPREREEMTRLRDYKEICERFLTLPFRGNENRDVVMTRTAWA